MPDKTSEPDDPEQSRRFIEMAREVEAEESDPAFAAKIAAIARHKPEPVTRPKK